MTSMREAMRDALEKQGATVRNTKKGLWIQTPKGTTSVHFTNSDRRAQDNEIAAFRRIGLVHPEDKRPTDSRPVKRGPDGYPAYMHAAIKPDTKKRFLGLLADKGWPTVVTVGNLREFGANTEVARALFAVGYRYPLGPMPKGGYVWEAPDDIKELHEQARLRKQEEPVPAPAPDPEPEPEPEHAPDVDVEKPTETSDDLDFIDERDSWIVDLEELLGSSFLFIKDKLDILGVLGMEYEFRVWRRKGSQ